MLNYYLHTQLGFMEGAEPRKRKRDAGGKTCEVGRGGAVEAAETRNTLPGERLRINNGHTQTHTHTHLKEAHAHFIPV